MQEMPNNEIEKYLDSMMWLWIDNAIASVDEGYHVIMTGCHCDKFGCFLVPQLF